MLKCNGVWTTLLAAMSRRKPTLQPSMSCVPGMKLTILDMFSAQNVQYCLWGPCGMPAPVVQVKRAEADAESKYLSGVGVARQRQVRRKGRPWFLQLLAAPTAGFFL